jgi:hypothetical protein
MRPEVSHSHGHEHEHEIEPQFGLPELLPQSEQILWQGCPDWKAMARHVFHVRKLMVYFAFIIAIRVFVILTDGGSLQTAAISALWLTILSATALLILTGLAYISAKTAVYTITTHRLVMRVGMVLTLTFNLPFKRIAAADFRKLSGSTGDIPVRLMGNDKIAYVQLWPHVRPWRYANPEPMMRCLSNAEQVAEILAKAWSARVGEDASIRVSAVGGKADVGPPRAKPAQHKSEAPSGAHPA